MKTTSAFQPTRQLSLLLACGFLLAACADSTPLAPAASDLSPSHDVSVMFNPQPDPPKEILSFLIDTPELFDGRPWQGVFGERATGGGILNIEQLLPAVQLGETLRLRQRWTFTGDGVALPAVQLEGLLNLRSGRLVLTGRGADGGLVQVQGWSTAGGGAIGGELMFNPQPDPPKEF